MPLTAELDDAPLTAPRASIDTFENELRNSGGKVTRNAGMILTLGYVFLAVVGMTYNFFYFSFFGINVLEYSETSDFIVAGAQSPVVVFLAVLPAILLWIAVGVRRMVRRRVPRYDAYARRHEARYGRHYRLAMMMLMPTLVLTYALTFTLEYAKFSAKKLQRGTGHHVLLTRSTPAASDSAKKLLMGTTSKYLFFYDTLAKVTEIIPVDNVAALTVALPASRRAK